MAGPLDLNDCTSWDIATFAPRMSTMKYAAPPATAAAITEHTTTTTHNETPRFTGRSCSAAAFAFAISTLSGSLQHVAALRLARRVPRRPRTLQVIYRKGDLAAEAIVNCDTSPPRRRKLGASNVTWRTLRDERQRIARQAAASDRGRTDRTTRDARSA